MLREKTISRDNLSPQASLDFIQSLHRMMAQRWAAFALACIILSVALLSLYWVVLVPIYQSPDEPQHLDYAFTIFSVGHLLRARDTPAVMGFTHPYSIYLAEKTNHQLIAFHPQIKAPANYGTRGYFQALDQGVPKVVLPLSRGSNYLGVYPFGFYALLAIWLGLLSIFSHSLVWLFFGARVFSVFLLLGSLVLSYAIARELRIRRGQALLLTAIIGFFPLTSFVSSYVQPDNLSLLLVSLSFYSALRVRRTFRTPGYYQELALLGIALGLLLVTKYHFYLCVLVPIVGMLFSVYFSTSAPRRKLLVMFGWLFFPALFLGFIQVWINWGTSNPYAFVTETATGQAVQQGIIASIRHVLMNLVSALQDFYLGGLTSQSYWGLFGWLDTPLTIWSGSLDNLVRFCRISLTLVVILLTLVRLEDVSRRLALLTRRGRWQTAVRIAFSNPIINSYYFFTLFMLLLYVLTDNLYGSQGRQWFPYILPAFLVGIHYAPRAFTHYRIQRFFSTFLLVGVMLYCACGSYYAVLAIKQRYYDNGREITPLSLSGLKKLHQNTRYAIDYFTAYTPGSQMHSQLELIPAGSTIYVEGWAINETAQTPAGGVFVCVDDTLNFQTVYGDERPDVGQTLHNAAFIKSGFDITFSTDHLAVGKHYLTLKIVTRDLAAYYVTRQKIAFEIK